MSTNLPLSAAIKANHYPEPVQAAQLRNLQHPEWAIPPLNIIESADPTPWGISALRFHQACLMRLRTGEPLESIIGSERICVNQLIHRETKLVPIVEEPRTISEWACHQVSTFVPEFPLFIQCFAARVHTDLMKWHLVPTLEHYLKIPSHLRPNLKQRIQPHLIAWDYVAMGNLISDYLIDKPTDIITAITTTGVHVNWSKNEIPFEFDYHGVYLSAKFEKFCTHPLFMHCHNNLRALWPDIAGLVESVDGQHVYPKDLVELAWGKSKLSPSTQVDLLNLGMWPE